MKKNISASLSTSQTEKPNESPYNETSKVSYSNVSQSQDYNRVDSKSFNQSDYNRVDSQSYFPTQNQNQNQTNYNRVDSQSYFPTQNQKSE